MCSEAVFTLITRPLMLSLLERQYLPKSRGVENLTSVFLTASCVACILYELDYRVGFIELRFEDVDLCCQNWFCVLMSTTAASNDARRYCEVNVHSGNAISLL